MKKRHKSSGKEAPRYAIGGGQEDSTNALEYTGKRGPLFFSTLKATGREATGWLRWGGRHLATDGSDSRQRSLMIGLRVLHRRRSQGKPNPPQDPDGGPTAA